MKKITCSGCGAEYSLSYTRIPVRDKDSIDCEVCQMKLYSWNEAKIWSAELIMKKHTK
ncbi:MAG: hypothetical protein AB9833_03955 [Bacteroidales bacterium]